MVDVNFARVDVNFARVDVNFQTDTVTVRYIFFHFHISLNQGPTYTPYKISVKYTLPFWRNGLKCQSQCNFLGKT